MEQAVPSVIIRKPTSNLESGRCFEPKLETFITIIQSPLEQKSPKPIHIVVFLVYSTLPLNLLFSHSLAIDGTRGGSQVC